MKGVPESIVSRIQLRQGLVKLFFHIELANHTQELPVRLFRLSVLGVIQGHGGAEIRCIPSKVGRVDAQSQMVPFGILQDPRTDSSRSIETMMEAQVGPAFVERRSCALASKHNLSVYLGI